ncbi:MAG TPA: ATP-dependent zinc metalloprotease FtsH [Thermomicrobiales bacterium]|nr:ATP-dependent zinc metalloprotease FtsH [Thermomicrobiales bacterium]
MSQDPKKPQLPLMRPDNDQNRQQKQAPKGGGTQPPERRTPRIPTWVVATLIIALVGWYIWEFFGPSEDPDITGVTYSAVTEQIDSGNVDTAILSETKIEVELGSPVRWDEENNVINNDAPQDSPGVVVTDHLEATLPQGVDNPNLLQSLEDSGAIIEGRTSSGSLWTSLLFSFLPFLLFLGLIVFMGRQMSRGQQNVFGFGRSKARQNDPERPQVTFADVAGEDEAKQELMEVVDFLRNPAKYHALGARLPRGVLLVGPPGTGKTLTARAVAGEAGVPFFSVSASEFVEMFVGVGASRVRDLFDKAKAASPAIIFVDEMDAVGRQRFAGLGGSNDEREQTLNQLLVEMDGFETNQEVIVMAATNRPDVLDPALLRPGRFDRQVTVGLPDKRGRIAILAIHTRGIPLNPQVELDHIAKSTTGFSGADLSNLVNEAALTAARRNRKEILQADFDEALDKILLGVARSGLVNDREKEVVAYHEAGHAIVAHFTPGSDPLRKVSVVPRGRSLGVTVQMPDEDRYNYSRTYLLGRLAGMLGGRAAEMVVYGEITTGAENDLKQATSLARRMVGLWGMSEDVGPVYLGTGEEHVFLGREITQDKSFSDATSERLDSAVREMVENALRQAVEINQMHRGKLDSLVKALMERETLDAPQVYEIFGPSVPEDPEAGMVRHAAPASAQPNGFGEQGPA